MTKKLRKGSAVEVPDWKDIPSNFPIRGTVTQVGRVKARVLFPSRKFIWLPIDRLKVVGFDGDGSSVHWR